MKHLLLFASLCTAIAYAADQERYAVTLHISGETSPLICYPDSNEAILGFVQKIEKEYDITIEQLDAFPEHLPQPLSLLTGFGPAWRFVDGFTAKVPMKAIATRKKKN